VFRVALKDILARKRRLVTTGIAVILGISFLAGTQILSGVLRDSIDSLFSDVYEGFDAVVRDPDVQDTDFGAFRPPVDAEVVGRVEAVEGVRAAYGIVESPTVGLIGKDGKVSSSGFGPPTLAFGWIDDPIRPGKLVEGRGPSADDEMAMDFKTAENEDFAIGDTVQVATQAQPRSFTLVGLLGLGEEGDRFSGAKPLYFTTPVAQELAGLTDQFSYIAAGAEEGVSQTTLARSIGEAVPELQVVTGEAFTVENSDQVAQFVGILTTAVSVFGVIALVVAAFIIYNTFSILVAQRTRETALLRAIGAKRRQVVAATLVEAVIIGVVASAVGLLFGTLLATGIKNVVDNVFSVQPGVPRLTGGTVVLAFSIGIGVTAISAIIPAIRASRVPPIAALTSGSIDRTRLSTARKVWGSLFTVLGAALLAAGLAGADNALTWVGLGLLFVLVAVVVVFGPVLAKPASRGLGRLLGSSRRMTARIAAENGGRNPQRTAATAAALTVGVTVVVLVAMMASSLKASFTDEIEGSLGEVDLIVSAGNFSFLGVPKEVATQAAEVDGVEIVSPVAFSIFTLLDEQGRREAAEGGEEPGSAEQAGAVFGQADNAPPGESAFATGIDPSSYFDLIDMGEIVGEPTASQDAAIIARAAMATERGWEIGDAIPVFFNGTGEQTLTLVATYSDGLGPDDDYYMPNRTVSANALPGFDIDFALYIALEEGADRAAVQAELEGFVADRPDVTVQDRQEFVETQVSFINVFVAIVYGLLFLAIIIALIGIANTLSLSVLERTREFGLLRAVGMSRRQLRSTIRIEAAIVAVFGALMGMVLGVGSAVAVLWTIARDEPGLLSLRVPWLQLLVIGVLAALAGMVSGVLPARRAARLDVLDAIASE
jgi:putative ABC transport system permease protein